jgi:YVTN family beta-propeller protein
MRASWCCAVLCFSVAAATAGVAQSRLLVVSQRDHTFHVYDPVTLNELKSTVEDGGEDAGHEVIASPDGKTAFVPLYGDAGVGRAGTDGDHIDVFDVATGKLEGTIPYGHGVRLHKPIYDPHTGTYLVTAELDKAIAILDPKTRKFVGSIPTGQEQSHMITLLPDGKKLYSANVGPGTVSVMDVPNRKLLKVIPISKNTQRISSSVDGKWVFTADQTKPELVVIDTKTDEVSKRITLPDVGYGTTPTPDGKFLLVTMDKQEGMAVVDLKSMTVSKTITTPRGIDEVVVSPDSKTAYATSAKTDKVLSIDLVSMTTKKVVPSGKFPDGIWLTK